MNNEIRKECMTLDELIDHIFSFEEEMHENVYGDELRHLENINIKDPVKLVEDIEEIFHTVLEIAIREMHLVHIHPDFDKDVMAEILRFKKEQLEKIESEGTVFGDLADKIEIANLVKEIKARTGCD